MKEQPLDPPWINNPDNEEAKEIRETHEQNIEDAIDDYRWRMLEKQLDEILKMRAKKKGGAK